MHLYNLKKSVCNSLGININMVKFLRKQGVKIGDNCEIHQHVDFGSEPYLITLGNNVRITNGVRFFTHEGGVHVIRNMYDECKNIDEFAPIVIGNNVHIGVNVLIMPGVHIGNNCIVGAGAVVTHDITDGAVAVGVPARRIGNVDDFYEKHKSRFINTKKMSEGEKKKYILEHL